MTFLTLLLFIGGLALLIIGAEALVKGASRLAISIGISPLVVGLTVVAFGTSSPELAVSMKSSFAGQPDIALGNVVGSNIFNVLFILGLAAMIAPLVVAQQLVKLDVPIMIAVSFLVFIFGMNGAISNIEGGILFLLLIGYTTFLIVQSRKESKAIEEEYSKEFSYKNGSRKSYLINTVLIVAGLAMLIFGSNFMLDASVQIAKSLGVSQLVIGLTIVSVGTSLPEVFTSVIATLRGERDIAVGNIVGSNIFNILSILGLTSLVSPGGIKISQAAINFDIPVMIAVAIASLPIFFTGNLISRWEGALFFFYYTVYTAYLFFASTQHELLPFFSDAMLLFVIPLTVITLLVIVYRTIRKNSIEHK